MRLSLTFCVCVALCGLAATAQTMPKSNYFCSVSSSGMMMCIGPQAPPPVSFNGVRPKPDPDPKGLFVIRYSLESGAELSRMNQGQDVLIVAMSDGELVNEGKSPQTHITVSNGFVMLLNKEEDYRLRNAGSQALDLLVIDVRK